MKRKRIAMSSIALATLMLVSLFAVVSSPASVSGQASGTTAPIATNPVGGTRTGTGPAASTSFTTGETEIFAVDLVVASGTRRWRQAVTVPGTPSVECLPHHPPPSHGTPATSVSTSLCAALTAPSGGSTTRTAWSEWESLGGQTASGTGPAVASWSAGRLDVFVARYGRRPVA